MSCSLYLLREFTGRFSLLINTKCIEYREIKTITAQHSRKRTMQWLLLWHTHKWNFVSWILIRHDSFFSRVLAISPLPLQFHHSTHLFLLYGIVMMVTVPLLLMSLHWLWLAIVELKRWQEIQCINSFCIFNRMKTRNIRNETEMKMRCIGKQSKSEVKRDKWSSLINI